ncbi:MAG: FlgD immunoglobulin-like domain containing protein, partial [Fibrobacteraceae bacterium]
GLTGSSSRSQRYNNERYVLLGEPVVSMPNSSLDVSLDEQVDTLHALDSMTLSGSVSGLSKGSVHVAVLEQSYEKKLSKEPASSSLIPVLYDGSLIFSENAEVKDGRFSVSFITPRKIAFGDTAAQIRLWAYGTSSSANIGRGFVSGIAINGTSAYADSIIKNDTVPPAISIQSCLSPASGTSFSEGQTVTFASPACVQVTLEDSTALDFREEADEGIYFEVASVTSPFHPWPYFEQESKKAVARMTFSSSKYPAGVYTFKVTAMDILGNESSRTIKVNITDNLTQGLSDVFTAPNPMKRKGTTFYFKNLAYGRTSSVTILIYNQNGRLVQRIPNAVSGVTTWDGKDFYGRKLANGLYHYVVTCKVAADDTNPQKTFTKKQKLVISR